MEASVVLEGINRTFRQHGLTTINAKPLDHVIAERDIVLLHHSSIKDLQTSLTQLIADGEHSRQVNQQLLAELQESRNSFLAEKKKAAQLAVKVEELERLKLEAQTTAEEIVVTRQAELQRHSEELEQAKESRDCAWAQVGVTRTENETLKKSVADLRECVKFLQSCQKAGTNTVERRSSSSSSGGGESPLKHHSQTLGMLSSSRERVQQLQTDINGLRQQMQDHKDGRSTQTSPMTERKSSACIVPRTLNSPTQSEKVASLTFPECQGQLDGDNKEKTMVANGNRSDGQDSCLGVKYDDKQMKAALSAESQSDVNNTFDTDNSGWVAMGEKIDLLNAAKHQLEEELRRCKRQLQAAAVEHQCLEKICTQLSVQDRDQIPDKLEKLLLAVQALPTLEDFYLQVTNLVPSPSAESGSPAVEYGSDTEDNRAMKSSDEDEGDCPMPHAPWCTTNWEHVVPTLRVWKDSVDKASQSSRVSHRRYHTMLTGVKHVQSLFNIHQLSGLAPAMSAVYSRICEADTLRKSIMDLLNLEEKASTSKLISTLQLLVENDSKLSLMTLARERDSLKASLDNSTSLLLAFRKLMQDLLAAADVDAPSKLNDAVLKLKEKASSVEKERADS